MCLNYHVNTQTKVKQNLSCVHKNAELSYMWNCSNGTCENLRTNSKSLCHSSSGEIHCQIELDAKESNYTFFCSIATLGISQNVVTKYFYIIVTAIVPCKQIPPPPPLKISWYLLVKQFKGP